MAWNFDPSLSSDKDWVRFLIGDTNTNAQLVADETIEAMLTQEMNIYMTAASICMSLARGQTRGGTVKDRKVGETKIAYRTTEDLILMARDLRLRGAAYMKPSAGGTYTADKDAYDANTALDKSELAKNMMDNPRSGSARSLTNVTT